jgi:hypothetical protein
VPSLPSSRNENTWRSDVDAHFVPDDLERVCESCLVPSLPSKIKETNAGGYFCMSTADDVDMHFLSDDLERVCASMQQKKDNDDFILCQSISRALTAGEYLLHTKNLRDWVHASMSK